MRVVLHDYSGHPFQAQLARALAGRGHDVEHVSCTSYVSGKGRLQRVAGDPAGLRFSAVPLGSEFAKYSPLKRLAQEVAYARLFLRHLRRSGRPDVLVMCNVPLLAHWLIWLRTRDLPQVFWHQDVYSLAWSGVLRKRLGALGVPPAWALERMERAISRAAGHVVVIADTFLPVHRRWGTPARRLTVQPNWAPVDELTPRPRAGNPWASAHDLGDRPVLLYSGTLGLKHDTRVFADLIGAVRQDLPDAVLVVVSAGEAARALHRPDRGIVVLPYQPFADLPDMFGSADLLLTVLEPDASDYSVPSKTLSYLCAGRPVVALVPRSNPAFDIVADAGGLPYDLGHTPVAQVAADVTALLQDAPERERRGATAREYAEEHFDVAGIADRFEGVLRSAVGPR